MLPRVAATRSTARVSCSPRWICSTAARGPLRKSVLEVVARLPYQAWETASYKKLNKVHDRPASLAGIWDRIRGFRAQQDNESSGT